ncbi:MAG: hypothetical protein WC848_05415, partial [Parcubacteria group bacterium]
MKTKLLSLIIVSVLIFSFLSLSSNKAQSSTCGNGTKEDGEECDFNSAFGPYPNQCPDNGPCNQATCTCGAPSPDPVDPNDPTCLPDCACSADTYIGSYCMDKCNTRCYGQKVDPVYGPGVGNPTEYVTFHNRYTRVPEDAKIGDDPGYAFANPITRNGGYEPYYRVFIPPGATHINVQQIAFTASGSVNDGSVTHFNTPPTGSPEPGGWPDIPANLDYDCSTFKQDQDAYLKLDLIESKECHARFNMEGYLDTIKMVGFDPAKLDQGGWLYIKLSDVNGNFDSVKWPFNSVSVRVDPKTYNDWWDHYGSSPDGSINWDKDVESVITYVAPTKPTDPINDPILPTGPDCAQKVCSGNSCWNGEEYIAGTKTQDCATGSAKANPTSIKPATIDGEPKEGEISYLTWSSSN